MVREASSCSCVCDYSVCFKASVKTNAINSISIISIHPAWGFFVTSLFLKIYIVRNIKKIMIYSIIIALIYLHYLRISA